MKLLWKIIDNPSKLWVKMISKKYFKGLSILDEYSPLVNVLGNGKILSHRETYLRKV